MVRETVEQRGRHLGVDEDAGPLAEAQIGGDDDRRALVEPADEMEEQLPAGLGEREVAQFVENDEVHAGQIVGNTTLAAGARFGFEPVDEIDRSEEPAASAGANTTAGNRDRQMAFPRAGSADQHGVALFGQERAVGETVDECLVDWRALEHEVVDVPAESAGFREASGSLAMVS